MMRTTRSNIRSNATRTTRRTSRRRSWPVPKTDWDKEMLNTEHYFSEYTYNALPFEAVTPNGGTTEALILVKIDENRAKMHAKMVLLKSEAEVETLFNELRKQEDALGYQKLYGYQNKKFKEEKEKLGIKFAWPANQK